MRMLDYWLTTPRLRLSAEQELQFAEARLRILGNSEAESTRDAMTKRLAGPARATDTYAPKISIFQNTTSLALRLEDESNDYEAVRRVGRQYELLIFITEAFATTRSRIHRALGITASQQHASTDLILPVHDRRWRYTDSFSTRTIAHKAPIPGLRVTQRTLRRFKSLGLDKIAQPISRPPASETLKRVCASIHWLGESLIEKEPSAAAVKTCIGLESLFGFYRDEPLRQSISDRVAFLLGRSAADRPIIAKSVREFYDFRSSIVHGDRKPHKWSDEEQQGVDRLLLISAVSLAHLAATHPRTVDLRAFFDGLKWSSAPSIPASPVAASLLRKVTGALSPPAKSGRQ